MFTEEIVKNIRIVEDSLWIAAFIMMGIVGLRYSEASFGTVRNGYLALIATAFIGIGWKGISLFSRMTGIKEPEILFDFTKEIFEACVGAVFIVGCVLLVKGLAAVYNQE